MLPFKIWFIINKCEPLLMTPAFVFGTFFCFDSHKLQHLSSVNRSYYFYLMKAYRLIPMAFGIITRTLYQIRGINLSWACSAPQHAMLTHKRARTLHGEHTGSELCVLQRSTHIFQIRVSPFLFPIESVNP